MLKQLRRVIDLTAFIVVLSAALAGVPAIATTFPPLDGQALLDATALAVEVEIVGVESRWMGRRVVTLYTAKIHEVLKGTPSTRETESALVRFGVPGGEVGAVGQKVFGAPRLAVGDRAVLLLGEDKGPGGARGIVALEQGVFLLDDRGEQRWSTLEALFPATPEVAR